MIYNVEKSEKKKGGEKMQNKYLDTLKAAFEHSPVPFAVLDSDMHIVYLNPALSNQYNDLENPIKLYSIFKDVDKQALINYLKSEKSYEIICDLPDRKDTHIYLSALFDDGGDFLGATATVPELSESREDMLDYIDRNDYQMAINRELRDRVSMMFSGYCLAPITTVMGSIRQSFTTSTPSFFRKCA